MLIGDSTQALKEPPITIGLAFTITIVSSIDLQPFTSVVVSVSIYVPAISVSNIGVCAIALSNISAGDHIYEATAGPVAEPINITDIPAQTSWSEPAFAIAGANTVTDTKSEEEHPLESVTIKV
jgi:hypothetical protein